MPSAPLGVHVSPSLQASTSHALVGSKHCGNTLDIEPHVLSIISIPSFCFVPVSGVNVGVPAHLIPFHVVPASQAVHCPRVLHLAQNSMSVAQQEFPLQNPCAQSLFP